MIYAPSNHRHFDITTALLDWAWGLMSEVQAIIVTSAASGSISTAIPPLLTLVISEIRRLGRRSFRNWE